MNNAVFQKKNQIDIKTTTSDINVRELNVINIDMIILNNLFLDVRNGADAKSFH